MSSSSSSECATEADVEAASVLARVAAAPAASSASAQAVAAALPATPTRASSSASAGSAAGGLAATPGGAGAGAAAAGAPPAISEGSMLQRLALACRALGVDGAVQRVAEDTLRTHSMRLVSAAVAAAPGAERVMRSFVALVLWHTCHAAGAPVGVHQAARAFSVDTADVFDNYREFHALVQLPADEERAMQVAENTHVVTLTLFVQYAKKFIELFADNAGGACVLMEPRGRLTYVGAPGSALHACFRFGWLLFAVMRAELHGHLAVDMVTLYSLLVAVVHFLVLHAPVALRRRPLLKDAPFASSAVARGVPARHKILSQIATWMGLDSAPVHVWTRVASVARSLAGLWRSAGSEPEDAALVELLRTRGAAADGDSLANGGEGSATHDGDAPEFVGRVMGDDELHANLGVLNGRYDELGIDADSGERAFLGPSEEELAASVVSVLPSPSTQRSRGHQIASRNLSIVFGMGDVRRSPTGPLHGTPGGSSVPGTPFTQSMRSVRWLESLNNSSSNNGVAHVAGGVSGRAGSSSSSVGASAGAASGAGSVAPYSWVDGGSGAHAGASAAAAGDDMGLGLSNVSARAYPRELDEFFAACAPTNPKQQVLATLESLIHRLPFEGEDAEQRREICRVLYFRVLLHVLSGESMRIGRMDFSHLLYNVNFHQELFSCVAQTVAFVYKVPNLGFPAVLQRLDVSPLYFCKVIESFVRFETSLPPQVQQHFKGLQQLIMERLVWQEGSPIFALLENDTVRRSVVTGAVDSVTTPRRTRVVSALGRDVPVTPLPRTPRSRASALGVGASASSAESASASALFASASSNIGDVFRVPAPPASPTVASAAAAAVLGGAVQPLVLATSSSSATAQSSSKLFVELFLRKVLLLASSRLADMASRLELSATLRQQSWLLFVESVAHETHLLRGRCLDHILMCCLYSVCKATTVDVKFKAMVTAFRSMPDADPAVFREVIIGNGKVGDIVMFYNDVFLPAMRKHVLDVRRKAEADLAQPPPQSPRVAMYGPLQVSVSPGGVPQASGAGAPGRSQVYAIGESPTRQLDDINRTINTGAPTLATAKRLDLNASPSPQTKRVRSAAASSSAASAGDAPHTA